MRAEPDPQLVVQALAPPHGLEPRSSHSKCDILPLDEGGMVRPAGFEPASPRLKGEHPRPERVSLLRWSFSTAENLPAESRIR